MMKSMTGYAVREFTSKTLHARISIRTQNHRFIDWSYRGTQIRSIEDRLRAVGQKKIHRGRVDVTLDLNFLDPEHWVVKINEGLLETLFLSMDRVSARFEREFTLSAKDLFGIPHVIELSKKDFDQQEIDFLEQCFTKTLDDVIKARIREGRELKQDIRLHLQKLRGSVQRLEKLAGNQPKVIREKLRERLRELDRESNDNPERYLEEAAYLAQRYDLAEEIARLKSHLIYIRDLLSDKNQEPIGKKLDFIAQELQREANTISSKSQDIAITKESLNLKGEIESIRQQAQNIE